MLCMLATYDDMFVWRRRKKEIVRQVLANALPSSTWGSEWWYFQPSRVWVHIEANSNDCVSAREGQLLFLALSTPPKRKNKYHPKNTEEEYSHAQQHSPLHIIALSILDDIVRNQHAHEEDYRLERLEIQAHRLPDDPAKNHEKGRDQQRDLHAATDSDADGEIHLLVVVSTWLLEWIMGWQKCCG